MKQMKVKVRAHGMLAETEKSVLFLISEREVWLPKWAFRRGPGRTLIVDRKIAENKNLKFSEYIHKPEPIGPVYNQEPIDELGYDASRRD